MRYGINIGMGFRESCAEQAETLARVGYDACFVDWDEQRPELAVQARAIRACGLELQSVHAPFGRVHTLWEEGGDGDRYAAMLADCIRDCADCGVPIVVMHVIIGFDRHQPNALGVRRFGGLLDVARRAGVRIAFENTEGEEYLKAVMDAFRDHPSCGFCVDTGHEQCYNAGRDMLGAYGDRLVATHLNDNFGQTDPAVVTWLDDSHVLPGDGIVDWSNVRRRLAACGFHGVLTMELTRDGKPGRHTHDGYADWSLEQFAAQALQRAKAIFEPQNEGGEQP